jgi:hypothetical protein
MTLRINNTQHIDTLWSCLVPPTRSDCPEREKKNKVIFFCCSSHFHFFFLFFSSFLSFSSNLLPSLVSAFGTLRLTRYVKKFVTQKERRCGPQQQQQQCDLLHGHLPRRQPQQQSELADGALPLRRLWNGVPPIFCSGQYSLYFW